MIDRLARSLAAAFPDLAGEDLADALWLAARYGDSTEPSTVELAVTDAAPAADPESVEPADAALATADLALPDDEPKPAAQAVPVTEVGLRIPASGHHVPATALSLFRRVHRPGPPEVDIDATVEATADARRLVVVTRPARERGLDVAIVVDRTPVAAVWADAIAELAATLRRTGTFRSVTRWHLDGDVDLLDTAGTVHSTDFIIDPSGRRLVLLLTDGTANRWYAGEIWRVLGRWAHAMPVALVHLLPRTYWGYTATGRPTAAVRSRRPATPNSTVDVTTAWWSDADGDVPLPVIALTQDDIVRWTHAVVAGSAWVDAVWAQQPAAAEPGPLSAADRVHAFQTRASGGAQELARVLAGAPLLSLPLIRVLHEHLVPRPETGHLAELLVSGLLETPPGGVDDSANLLLRFRPGVADLLYQGTTTSQEWDVFEVLTNYLERNAGSGNTVRALLADPHGRASVEGNLVPFAALGRGVATRLGIELPVVEEPRQSTVDAVAVPVTRGRSGVVCLPDLYSGEQEEADWVAAMAEGLTAAGDTGNASVLRDRGVTIVRISDLRTAHTYRGFVNLRSVQEAARERLAAAVTEDTRVIVAHAYGAEIAYEALCANPDWTIHALITLEASLARHKSFLLNWPEPAQWPGTVSSWTYIVSQLNPFVSRDLPRLFGGAVEVHVLGDERPFSAEQFLASPVTGAALSAALRGRGSTAVEVADPRRFLLTCVVDDYLSPNLPNLSHGGTEADTVIGFFRSLGYAHISLTPTRTAILDMLRQFVRDPDRRADDVLVLYLSGHGTLSAEGKYFFLPTDARSGREDTAISARDLVTVLLDEPVVSRYLVVVDTGMAGQAGHDVIEMAAEPRYRRGRGRPAVAVIASTSAVEPAAETGFARAFVSAVEDGFAERSANRDFSLKDLTRRINHHRSPASDRRAECVWNNPVADEFAAFFPRTRITPERDAVILEPGRDRAAERILRWLLDTSDRRTLVLTGSPGSGKTSVLNHVMAVSDSAVWLFSAPDQRWAEITPQLSTRFGPTVFIDGFGEAEDPDELITELRLPQIRAGESLPRVLVAARPHLLPRLTRETDVLVVDLDSREYGGFEGGHHTIFLADVMGYGDMDRMRPNYVALRAGMYEAVQQAFEESGISWDECYHQDVGDSILVLAPAAVPKGAFVEELPDALAAALRAHNETHPPKEQIKLRMGLHAGEVTYDEHGVIGPAIIHAARLLDAPPVKNVLANSPGPLAVIVSDWFYDEVVRHGAEYRPDEYRQVDVRVKEFTDVGWIRLPGTEPASQKLPASAAQRQISTFLLRPATPQFYEVADVLEDIPCMRSDRTRALVIDQLRFGDSIRFFSSRRAHIISILRTCLDYEDGVLELLSAISGMEPGDSAPVKRLITLLAGDTL